MNQQQTIVVVFLAVGVVSIVYWWWARKQEEEKATAAAAEAAAKATAALEEEKKAKAAKEAAEKKQKELDDAERARKEEDEEEEHVSPTPQPPKPWLVSDLANHAGILVAVRGSERLALSEFEATTNPGVWVVVMSGAVQEQYHFHTLRFVPTSSPGVYYLQRESDPKLYLTLARLQNRDVFQTHEPSEPLPPFPLAQPEAWRVLPTANDRQFKLENLRSRTVVSITGATHDPTTFELQPIV